ncbi:MAG: hypothetical protein R6V50_00485 [Thermoplasmatota archaeon]
MRQDKEIYFHKEKFECDFVIRKGTQIIQAIQVTYHLQENKKREIDGLFEALTMYRLNEGLLLTSDQEEVIIENKKKIVIKPVWKWLLEEK